MKMKKQAITISQGNEDSEGKLDCCCNSQTPTTKAETINIGIDIFILIFVKASILKSSRFQFKCVWYKKLSRYFLNQILKIMRKANH